MTRVNYKSSSPYYNTEQKSWYLEQWNAIDLGEYTDDLYIEIEPKYNQRPDLLAYDLYGSTDYWWVFILRNRDLIDDPIYDLVSGMTLWAPSKSRLLKILS